jgi:fatty acid-binding protein DegV
MDNEQVSIVTDGMADMPPESVSRLGIHIVPWGKTQRGSLLPPPFSSFIQTYHRLQPSPILSIHPAGSLSSVGNYARLARNLLVAPRPSGIYERGVFKPLLLSSPAQRRGLKVKVFEAKAIDLGVRFMVTVAAQAAQEGYNEEELEATLRPSGDERAQEERKPDLH